MIKTIQNSYILSLSKIIIQNSKNPKSKINNISLWLMETPDSNF